MKSLFQSRKFQNRKSPRNAIARAIHRAVDFEMLETRQLLSATISVDHSTLYFNDVKGGGSSPSQSITIKNTGSSSLTIPANGITLGGTNKSEFSSTAGTAAITISAGSSKSISLKFSAAAVGIRTGTLSIKSNSSTSSTKTINLRGLGTAGLGGNLEPSLQRILDLFQIPDKDGDSTPDTTDFPSSPSLQGNEVLAQQFVKAGSGSVSIQLLATFVNDKQPATTVGYYTHGSGSSLSQHDLFKVPNSSHTDYQSVHPATSGSTSFDPGSTAFGLYTVFPAFSNRKAYSEDSLNTWDSADPRKIRVYPMKNPDGSTVANSYVFATEDYNKAYDSNDVVAIIKNVKPASSSSGGGSGGGGSSSGGSSTGSISNIANLGVLNQDTLPSNDRMVFNRIEHPDTVRANVTDDTDSLKLTNTGSSSMSLSISVLDSSDFQITSGGGNITLGAGKSDTVTIKFKGSSSGSTILKTFQSNLLIKSGSKTDTVVLAGLWQSYSEQTPANPHHIYDEPSLSQVVNTIFGYKTDVANSNQEKASGDLVKLGNHGDRTAVGDEVLSQYWQAANSGSSVKVQQIAAFHRQNNFDDNGKPLTAASTISYYTKGSSSKHKIFQHNDSEGQSLLPHNGGSSSSPAAGSFSPGSQSFYFRVDSLYSLDSMNPSDFDPNTGKAYSEPTGHAFRFYPLKDENGKVIANTYIVAQDYTGLSYSNYDYQDNIYIVSNIKPSSSSSSSSSTSSSAVVKSNSTEGSSSLASQLDMTDTKDLLA